MEVSINSRMMPSLNDISESQKEVQRLREQIDYHQKLLAEKTALVEKLTSWISAARRMPTELLVEIFKLSTNRSGLAPLRLAAVCRRWRDVALASPILWTRLPLKKREAVTTLLPLFMERSEPCLLHVGLPPNCEPCFQQMQNLADKHSGSNESSEDSQEEDSLSVDQNSDSSSDCAPACQCPEPTSIFNAAKRIRCISIHSGWTEQVLGLTFPHLTRLGVGASPLCTSTFPLAEFTRSRFPVLRHLSVSGMTFSLAASIENLDPPPLEHLGLHVDDTGAWGELLHACAGTLKSLVVEYCSVHNSGPKVVVKLPALESLVLTAEDRAIDSPLSFQAETPKLKCLIMFDYGSNSPANLVDVGNVSLLRINFVPDLDEFSSLQTLQLFSNPNAVVKSVRQLNEDDDCCPELEFISFKTCPHVSNIEFEREEKVLLTLTKRQVYPINFTVISTWENQLTELDRELMRHVGMPCHLNDDDDEEDSGHC